MWQKSASASASNMTSGGALVPISTNASEQTALNGGGGGSGAGYGGVVNGGVDGGANGSGMVSTTDIGTAAGGGTPPSTADEFQALIDEMRVKDFDSIRFATYRTACKLRFVQSRTNVHLVDIWNMIESFRENGLNAILTTTHLKVSRLELLLTSVFHNLNKRLPATQHIETDKSISTLLSFLLHAYDRQSIGRLTIFSIKVALATLCAGKLVDKLRYIFSQISDTIGLMEYERFADYLQQVLALPSAVFEGPTFGFSESALAQCFKRDEAVNLNQFLDVIMSDLCPPCLMWLPLLHRMASVEHVYHPVVCDACQVGSFTGFRYKCQRCTNYQLCQSCFWRGRTSQSHSNEHEMKEYSSYKSPTKEIAHSIQKSLQCVPRHHRHHAAATASGSRNSLASSRGGGGRAFGVDRPPRPFDLANLVNVTPNSMRHQPPDQLVDWTMSLLPGQYGNGNAMDDEHKLIARYAAKLAGRTSFPSTSKLDVMSGGGRPLAVNTTLADEHALIATLEEENNEMLRELAFLEQQQNLKVNSTQLNGLRERTAELEARMSEKQQLRRQLMQQLELLMSQLNSVPATGNTMPRMTNGGVATEKIHPIAALGGIPESTGGVPSSASVLSPTLIADSLPAAQLQGDLLQAAGAITSNMSNLVQELDQVTDELDGHPDNHRSNSNNNNPHNNNYNHHNNSGVSQNNEQSTDDLPLMPPKLNGR